MNVIIVATKTPQQEIFWQKRLRKLCGIICKQNTFIIAVHEKRIRGASYELEPLINYDKAQEKAKFMYGIDLYELQKNGATITIYNDTWTKEAFVSNGKGNFDNLFELKLPGEINGRRLTLLEAIIAQTSNLDLKRGRLSMFRCDHIHAKLEASLQDKEYHIEICNKMAHPSSQANWIKLSFSAQMTFALLREFKKEIEKRVILNEKPFFFGTSY